MIYYYSGTGNSANVANELSRLIGEKHPPVNIPAALQSASLDVYTTDKIGFVFPIYSWGVPPVVLDFTARLPREIFYKRYIWAVCTCGDEAGNAMKKFAKTIKKISDRQLDLCMSVIMPNTYVLLPGFDVDTHDIAEEKLKAANTRLRLIADYIKEKKSCFYDVNTGSMPGLRSLVYPFFKKWGMNTKKWKATNNCISCGLCTRICPVNNVNLSENGKPVWGTNCLSCCACFHVCPKHAVEYGKVTCKKGQYLFPGYINTLKK
ncbi:MAG: EFR1 family ferrodoxin [Prevotella sp.]|nr:EFR1 family ferrodoxin [Prevotella sp.]MCM1075515.1 EFR1 family ferrodoxin [Ruminococcus sp.]